MTSQTTIDESVFGDLGISRSLKAGEVRDSEKLRRRHKSASDSGLRRAATLQEYDVKLRHHSSDLDHLQMSNALSAKVAQSIEQGKEGAAGDRPGSRLSGPSVKPVHSTILEGGEAGDSVAKSDCTDSRKETDRTSEERDSGSGKRPVGGLDLKNKAEPSSESSSSDTTHILDLSPKKMEPVRALAKKPDDIFSELEDLKSPVARTSSTGSNTSSPSHSVRTPVTENDPLGLFHSPVKTNTIQSSLSGTPDLLGMNDSKDSGIATATSKSANRNNLLIDIEPFRSPSKERPSSRTDSALSTPKNQGAGDGDTRAYTLLKTSSSTSSAGSSSAGSPAAAWAPLSQSEGTTPSGRGDSAVQHDLAPPREETFHKSSTSPANLETLNKTPDHKPYQPGTPSSRRGKMLARGESFRNALSSTAKSTASFFSSKFSSKLAEFKQTMSPASTSSLDRLSSDGDGSGLPKAHEMDKNLVEDETREDGKLKKAGSEELLEEKMSFRNQSDTRSLDDTLDGTPSKSTPQAVAAKTYAGYGEFSSSWLQT